MAEVKHRFKQERGCKISAVQRINCWDAVKASLSFQVFVPKRCVAFQLGGVGCAWAVAGLWAK